MLSADMVLHKGRCDEATASTIRRRIRSAAELPTAVVEDVALAATELITNAVRAGARRLVVVICAPHRRTLELRVTDDAPGVPVVQHPSSSDAYGRGLRIVASVAVQWGVDAGTSEKTVWARFDFP